MSIMRLRTPLSGSHASRSRSARPVVEAIDHALWTLPPRSALTHREAALAVAEVMVAVAGSPDARTASDTLDRAVTATDVGTLIDRMVLVDALLDVRLAILARLAAPAARS